MKFVNIEYEKEYVELVQAFIPEYKDKDFIIGKAGDSLILITDREKYQVNIDYGIFTTKNSTIKHHLYKLLNKYTGKSLSWGILVGVNPIKLVLKLDNSYGEKKAREILTNKYLLSQDKINLAFQVLNNQKPYRDKYKDMYSVYINIPFCPSKCIYCTYPTYLENDEEIDKYLFSLKKEILEISRYLEDNIASIYIGGGTPASIAKDKLLDLVKFIKSFLNKPIEFNIELGRPDTIDGDLLAQLYKLGVNRISINPQSFNDESIKALGREHSSEDIKDIYNLAVGHGFEKINMDLIMAIDDLDSFKNSLNEIAKIKPDNLTIHALSYKKASDLEKNNYEQSSDFEKLRDEFISKSKYKPYYLYRQKNIYNESENIGYAIENPCIYNMCMMGDIHTVIGLGLASSSKIIKDNKIIRHMNYRTLNDYNNLVEIDIDKKIDLIRKDYNGTK